MDKPVYRNEKVLFFFAFLLSALAWGAIGYWTKGYALAVLPIIFLIYLFAQSGFICYLRGSGVLVTDAQYPDLQARVKACAEKIGLKFSPKVYVLNGNGTFNAFATSFLRKKYIVLLSDVIDGVEDKPEALNFYIGHEMGHLDRKHLLYQSFLSPGLALPLLGSAYLRAREYTCDMYGALCCATPAAAQDGLSLLAVGPKRYKTLNVVEYLNQARETSGFWMSFHELISSYPWLVKRYARVSPDPAKSYIPSRNFFAFLFAAFVPRLNLVSVAIIYIAILVLFMHNAMPGQAMLQQLGMGAQQQAEMPTEYEAGKTYDFGGKSYIFKGGDATDEKNWTPVETTK